MEANQRAVLKIPRSELSNLRMVAGNEAQYSTVIVDGQVKNWVGFGWITLRDATDEDRATMPEAV